MPGIEDEKNRILGSVGESGLDALRSIGIDPEHAVQSILIERFARQAYLTRKDSVLDLKSLPLQDLLTSELVLLMQGQPKQEEHKTELERRLGLLGLGQDQVQRFILLDQQALGKKDPHTLAEGTGVSLYITSETTPEALPSPESCLTSELIAIIDDANAAIARDHWLPGPTFSAAAKVSGWGTGESRYQDELVKRLNELGLDETHVGLFIRNESLILERERWGYEPKKMSWDPGMSERREQLFSDPERLKALEDEIVEEERRVRPMLEAWGDSPELIDLKVKSIRRKKLVAAIIGE